MRIQLLDDPAAFRDRTRAFVDADPISTNVITVVADRTIAGTQDPTSDDRWIVVEDAGGEVVGIGMANAPYNLFLSAMPAEAAIRVAETLTVEERKLPGVTGERSAASAFAETWCPANGCTSVVQIAHRVYRLAELIEPRAVEGIAELAEPDDIGLVARWLDDFHDEALPHDPQTDATVEATRRISAKEVWLWRKGEKAVAMAACSHAAAGVARIGPVYTPPALRGRGHAAGTTYAATAAALDRGAEHVMLYADRSNPTSNALYRRLGFEPDHEAEDLGFRPIP